ncbi:MAG: hypothetical protein ABJN36_08820 [Cyclobacteriaceae bacterium]
MNLIKITLLLVISTSVNAQFLNQKLLTVNGLSFISTKEQIIEEFGIPDRTFEPNYECGFLSSEEQGKEFHSLEYSGIKFTGNQYDNYLIEELDLTKNSSIQLNYGEISLNTIPTIEELAKILGLESEIESPTDTMLRAYFGKSDDAVFFIFKNGRLIKLDYWSPC